MQSSEEKFCDLTLDYNYVKVKLGWWRNSSTATMALNNYIIITNDSIIIVKINYYAPSLYF